MSSDEEADDTLMDLETIRDKMLSENKFEKYGVSAWDDDDGIDPGQNPDDADQFEILTLAEKGDLEKIQMLISKNPLLSRATDKDGYTPLHRACQGNSVPVLEFLLESGAKIDAMTNDGWQPLHSACLWNNVECAAALIANGADVNAKSNSGTTPLHTASASSHNSPTLQLLLLHPDTDVQLKNGANDTAYEIAKRTGIYHGLFEIAEPCLNKI